MADISKEGVRAYTQRELNRLHRQDWAPGAILLGLAFVVAAFFYFGLTLLGVLFLCSLLAGSVATSDAGPARYRPLDAEEKAVALEEFQQSPEGREYLKQVQMMNREIWTCDRALVKWWHQSLQQKQLAEKGE